MAATDQEMLVLVGNVETALRAVSLAEDKFRADSSALSAQYAEQERLRVDLNAAQRTLVDARFALEQAIQERAVA